MADASGGTTDLASLLRTNNVEALHVTVYCAPCKYLVWTRLPEDNSSWIINASDGVDLWHLRLDEEQLDSHRELAEIDKYETYFARFRLEFESGSISVSQSPNKVSLTVGTGIPSLAYDLYEAKASEKKTELQTVLFRLADRVSELTEQLRVSSDSLERMKNQKDGTASGSSIFDVPPKKTSQVLPVKRKQGHSLINPGSRKEAEVGVADGDNTEHNVHISVLGNDQTLDIYMCTDLACEHFCTKTNKRYHCPLCNNKPQKPGRMRRHFEKMHSGKQIVQHGGYQMLRCKLRCTKANGRTTDNSHYHCCLCGRVLVRKVHLYCHLQAHAVGSMQEIDEMLDAKDDTEEGPLGDAEMDDDDNDTSLDTSQIRGLESAEQDNMVALSDGTQVVFVQSIQGSETLTVVPLDEQSNTLQLTHHGAQSDDTSDLSAGLSALPSVSQLQEHLPQELTVKQVEAMLNKGGENSQDSSMTARTCQNLSDEHGDTGLQTLTSQGPSEIDMEPDADEAQSSMPKQVQVEAMEFEPCLQAANLQMSAASNISDTNMVDVPGVEHNNLPLGQVPRASDTLTSQNVDLTATTTSPLITSTPVQSVTNQGSSKLIMVNPMSKPLLDEEISSSQNQTPKTKTVRQDSLMLVDAASTPKGDDQVFKVLLNNLSPATSCFKHPSVLNETDNLDVHRCRNTFCDCRLYHCPLCTCLPNKPGRIREHFKKIHAQDLVIRYQGYQMLRCKLGCSRPSGTKVFNSHYHCCICGAICIRKSGVYEHMRINHSSQPVKKDGISHQSQEQKEARFEAVPKPMVMHVPMGASETSGPGTQQMAQPQTPQGQGMVTGSTTPQTVTVQLPQQGGSDGQSQQQLVIVMPHQLNQTQIQSPVQAQQPIVIVMPQTGGTHVAQPIVVPLPQVSNN